MSRIPWVWYDPASGLSQGLEIKTIEDVDYHWRLAHTGACYTHISEPLLVINSNSGLNKKEKSSHDKSIKQIIKKYEGVTMSPCGGCGKKARVHPDIKQVAYTQAIKADVLSMKDENFIMVLYTSGNIGNHRVIGAATRIDYGYHQGGQQMLVHKDDVAVSPHLFSPIISSTIARDPVAKPVEIK